MIKLSLQKRKKPILLIIEFVNIAKTYLVVEIVYIDILMN